MQTAWHSMDIHKIYIGWREIGIDFLSRESES